MQKPYFVTPRTFDKIWGGHALMGYGKKTEAENIGETWELSFMDGATASVDGKLLTDAFPKETWGEKAKTLDRFPILTKFIDAADTLSVQVHPDDAYAKSQGLPSGKTEMWVIVEAAPGAGLYMGMNGVYTKDEVRAAIAAGTLSTLLQFVPVKPGDVYFIPAGTVHAIGKGVLLYEIQQSADVTYRLYDYGRRDAKGRLRDLHIEPSLDVAALRPYVKPTFDTEDPSVIGMCDSFVTRYINVGGRYDFSVEKDSLACFTVLSGEVTVNGEIAQKGDTLLFPADSGEVTVTGTASAILVTL